MTEDHEVWRGLYEPTLSNSTEWWRVARQLRAAAVACYDRAAEAEERARELDAEFNRRAREADYDFEMDYGDVYDQCSVISAGHMLLAFAIENLAKALIVETGGVSPGDSLPNQLKSHRLRQLISSANIHLNDQEELILDNLEKYAVWRGRYPIPANARELQRGSELRNNLRQAHLLMPHTIRGIGQELLDRMESALHDAWERAHVE